MRDRADMAYRIFIPLLVVHGLMLGGLETLPAVAEMVSLSPEDATALRARFEARQRQTRTWSASFTQALTLPGILRTIVSEGTISFRAPEDLRIDFSKPAGEFVLVLGDRLFLQKPGGIPAERPLRSDSAGKPILSLLDLLRGRSAEGAADFTFSMSRDDDRYLIMLERRAGAEPRLPKRITNTISMASFELRTTIVDLPTGGTLKYAFHEIVRNGTLDARLFVPPVAAPLQPTDTP